MADKTEAANQPAITDIQEMDAQDDGEFVPVPRPQPLLAVLLWRALLVLQLLVSIGSKAFSETLFISSRVMTWITEGVCWGGFEWMKEKVRVSLVLGNQSSLSMVSLTMFLFCCYELPIAASYGCCMIVNEITHMIALGKPFTALTTTLWAYYKKKRSLIDHDWNFFQVRMTSAENGQNA